MRTRLISLVILLVVAGSAVAGAPLHSNEQSCSMGGAMGEMDCCKAALSRRQTPQATAARLCCSLNCSQNGTTPSNGVRTSPQVQPVSDYQFNTPTLPASSMLAGRVRDLHGPPTDSHPAYIRHLALLI